MMCRYGHKAHFAGCEDCPYVHGAHASASAVAESSRFAGWSSKDLAAQCRMQARDQLDPDFSAFMAAVADRLDGARAALSIDGETA